MFYKFAVVVVNIFYALFFRLRVNGLDTFPREGGAVICANHASYHDPVAIAARAPRTIRYMGKKELFNNRLLSVLITALYAIPLDRSGSDLKVLKNTIRLLKNGDVVGIFAQGHRIKPGDAAAAKSGVALLAIKAGVPVIPTSIKSTYKIFSVIEITFGKPIELGEYKKRRLDTETLKEATDMIMDKINEQLGQAGE